MPRRKVNKFNDLGEKDCWHSYSLQSLNPSKFSQVVGNILRGKYTLIVSRFNKQAEPRVNT